MLAFVGGVDLAWCRWERDFKLDDEAGLYYPSDDYRQPAKKMFKSINNEDNLDHIDVIPSHADDDGHEYDDHFTLSSIESKFNNFDRRSLYGSLDQFTAYLSDPRHKDAIQRDNVGYSPELGMDEEEEKFDSDDDEDDPVVSPATQTDGDSDDDNDEINILNMASKDNVVENTPVSNSNNRNNEVSLHPIERCSSSLSRRISFRAKSVKKDSYFK
jgi:hypothetical protein